MPLTPAYVAFFAAAAVTVATATSAPAQSILPQCVETPRDPVVRVGIRADAPPFSSLRPVPPFSGSGVTGYTVELCAAFLDAQGLGACYIEVDTKERFEKLADQTIDMLCGATTATLHVRDAFETSLYTFITATTVLVPPLDTARAGKTRPRIGYRDGTTADPDVTFETTGDDTDRITTILKRHFPNFAGAEWVAVSDHFSVIDKLTPDGGNAPELDAFIADKAILSALLRHAGSPPGFQVDGSAIRLQPYAIVLAPPGRQRAAIPSDLSVELNRFLVTERFAPGDKLKAYKSRLLEIFGRDVDASFLDLAEIQSLIPLGVAIDTGEPPTQ